MLTTVTPPADTDLTTLASVKAELSLANGTDDAAILAMIGQASAAIERDLNRGALGLASYVETFRAPPSTGGYSGRGRLRLMLSRTPVATITSIVEDGVTLTAGTDFDFEADTGFVNRIAGGRVREWTAQTIQVTYDAGYILPRFPARDLPADIERACLSLVKLYYFARNRDPLVKSEDVQGAVNTAYFVGGDAIPPDIAGLLDRFREISI
jgi:hypothetical protein